MMNIQLEIMMRYLMVIVFFAVSLLFAPLYRQTYSAIGGGNGNTIKKAYSVIPGGKDNEVSGSFVFAFGNDVDVSNDYTTAFYSPANPGKVGINEPDPHSTLHYDGSEASAITDSDMSLDDDDHTLFVDGGAAVSLPDASGCSGRIYYIRNIDDGNSSTITPTTSYIEESENYTLPAYEGIIIQSDGTDWWIIADFD